MIEGIDDVEGTPSLEHDVPAQEPPRRWRLLRFFVRRLGTAILTLLAASILIFCATNLLPGSPAANALGKFATPSEVTALNKKLGFDHPVPVLYVRWLGKAVRGDLGDSATLTAQTGAPVPIWPLIRARFLNTLTLALLATLLLVPLALVLGASAALRAGKFTDHSLSTITLALISLPEFVVGTLLIGIFFSALHLLVPLSLIPPGTAAISKPLLLIMPVLTLLATSVAWSARLVRAGMLEVLDSEYVQTARLHGLSEGRVITRYALRNAVAPAVQVFAVSIQSLFGGVIVTEVVFSYPGLGAQLVNAVLSHDTTLVQGIALLIAIFYILVNVIADVLVVALVPKLRTAV